MNKYRGFYLKIFEFLEMKSSIYLNRHVFVMRSPIDVQAIEVRLFMNMIISSRKHTHIILTPLNPTFI